MTEHLSSSDIQSGRLERLRIGKDIFPEGHWQRWWLAIIATLLIAWTLKATVWVSMPLAFAFFVALVVAPVDSWVRGKMPKGLRWMGTFAAMFLVLFAIAVYVGGIYFVARNVMDAIPLYSERLGERLSLLSQEGVIGDFRGWMQQTLGVDEETSTSGVVGMIASFAQGAVRSLGMTVSMALLIFFFAMLMLTEGKLWIQKLSVITTPEGGRTWGRINETIAARFRYYLVVRTILGVMTAALYGIWLFAFDVDLIGVWIVLTFMLNYIPTLGSVVSGILPFAFALAVKDTSVAFIIGAGLFTIEQVMGNYIDPKFQGKELSLSPLVILFSLLVWGYIWGVAGALIAVPLTVLLAIIFAYIEPLRPLALLMSNERSYSQLYENMTKG